MSQITDDCFAFGGPLMRAGEALRIIAERTPVVTGSESRTLMEAEGHVLASEARARSWSPPHDNAAVDGYAIRGEDLNADAETGFRVVGGASVRRAAGTGNGHAHLHRRAHAEGRGHGGDAGGHRARR